MFTPPNIQTIQNELGEGFASWSDRGGWSEVAALHQCVATMQHLAYNHQRQVSFKAWTWPEDQALMRALDGLPREDLIEIGYPRDRWEHLARNPFHFSHLANGSSSTVFFMYWAVKPTPSAEIIYKMVEHLHRRLGYTFRCFPSRAERARDVMKIEDQKVSDKFARRGAKEFPEYAVRPKIRYDHASHPPKDAHCPFSEIGTEQIVMKRVNSSGGKDVQVMDRLAEVSSIPEFAKNASEWFAQEWTPYFERVGEFRVFIVSELADDGLRCRKGRVLHIALTQRIKDAEGGRDIVNATVPTADDWSKQAYRPFASDDLVAFALHIYDQLRAEEDWESSYESLEMGVRLDICMRHDPWLGKKGMKGFFVNDIWRFYRAEFHSRATLGSPWQMICQTYGKAINEYFVPEREDMQ